MKNLFHDILDMKGVHGLIHLSDDGKVLFESFKSGKPYLQRSQSSWTSLFEALGLFTEMDIMFDNGRCYLRKAENGYLVISMSSTVSIAMIKLSCDIVVPQLKQAKTGGGLRAFFRR